VEFAVGVDSGFSALELILRAYGIGPGDEVITAANTFIATVGAIDITGARPVLVDIDPTTFNLDPELVVGAITPATRAVIAVHLYGHPADMDSLRRIAEENDLVLIEDACQAHGARYRGTRTGGLGHAAAFSFYPSKNLGAFGDGGMVTTNDARTAERVRLLRNLGASKKYHHTVKGFNRRLDTLQAAVLQAKLAHLDERNESRRETARLYAERLGDLPVDLPKRASNVDHVFHLFVIEVVDRTDLQDHLAEFGVATGIHYPIPVHLQPPYCDLAFGPGSYPVTEGTAERILSLPMYPGMAVEAITHTTDAIRSFYSS
jgi:dTDP-4-amino-4,6-dideoxygalactose transaminase